MNDLQKIAVVIDADNTQLAKLGEVLREVSTHGRIIVKRAYGNWKKQVLRNWEDELKRLAIKPEQQFDYVTGKNTTDMALVIDTIELLHKAIYDAFVIVSSDSDYTPLAIKLRESDVYVIGVGEKKTPESFRNSCDEFIFLENLSINVDNELSKENVTNISSDAINANDSINEIHKLLKIASDTYQDDDGYVNVSAAGTFIKRTKPDFDARSYGYLKLPQLLEAFPQKYEMKRYPGKGKVTIVAYKCK
ncbi:MAG: NYN domain-containing protein [Anaerotignum sp.]|nr:NYN domain-containing protein [Anaerotignum sp.]